MSNYKLLKVLIDILFGKLKYKDLKICMNLYKIYQQILFAENTRNFTSIPNSSIIFLKKFTINDIERLVEIHNKYTKNKKIGEGFLIDILIKK